MPNTKKKEIVKTLLDEVQQYDVIVLTDYSGLTHKQLEDVRSKVKNSEGDYQIVKTSLLKIALKEAGREQKDNPNLDGPTAALFANEANLTSIKVIYDTSREQESFKIKGGIWKTDIIDEAKIVRLATLPSRDQLIAMLLGQMKTPGTKLVLTLKNPLQKLAVVMAGIRDKRNALVQ
jgi:large subunit ribosomal protein L10